MLGTLCTADTSVAVLPPDIQQKICDVKQKQEAARLPWHNFQLDAATMTQHKLVQHASLARSGSSYDADAETDRQATALHDINSKSDFACPWVDMGTLR